MTDAWDQRATEADWSAVVELARSTPSPLLLAHVSPDGMQAFGMQIPRVFADVFAQTVLEMDPLDPDFAAIVAAACETTNQVALTYENFNMILPPGQINPVPFACMLDPLITHVLQPTHSRRTPPVIPKVLCRCCRL